MKKLMLFIVALAAFSGGALYAQNFTGTWQATLKGDPRELRIVIKISVGDDDKLKAELYSIDQQSPAIPASQITRDGSALKMTVAAIGGNYEGRLNADGNSITGTWTQGVPQPLNLVRATPETAWAIPDPPPPPKPMANPNPSFEVATIKPSRPEERFSLLVNRSGMMNTTSTSLSDLIKFAYGVYPKQITGAPPWVETEKYDVAAKPDTEGIPNGDQLKLMVQKLLTERFQLAFHRDKKELSVYAMTVTKTGVKLSKNETGGILPGFGGIDCIACPNGWNAPAAAHRTHKSRRGPPLNFNVRNSTMAEFAGVLQANILDRPVVDQTELGSTRYDFTLKWTPDPSPGANVPPAAPDPNAPPDLLTAFQQQLGLKLESTKAPVDVLVIDKVEKPSEN
jgi:uncharacterized protein (TIGR03435 family)